MLPLPVRRALLVLLLLACRGLAADVPVATTYGRVVKANAQLVILRPAVAGNRLGDAIVLKLTGTSRVSVVSARNREGERVVVQREVEAKDLRADQIIAAVYTVVDQDKVLLTAVVQPANGR